MRGTTTAPSESASRSAPSLSDTAAGGTDSNSPPAARLRLATRNTLGLDCGTPNHLLFRVLHATSYPSPASVVSTVRKSPPELELRSPGTFSSTTVLGLPAATRSENAKKSPVLAPFRPSLASAAGEGAVLAREPGAPDVRLRDGRRVDVGHASPEFRVRPMAPQHLDAGGVYLGLEHRAEPGPPEPQLEPAYAAEERADSHGRFYRMVCAKKRPPLGVASLFSTSVP